MKVENVVCDVCGVIKGQSNHWLALNSKSDYLVLELNTSTFAGGIVKDICSLNCLMKELNKQVAELVDKLSQQKT